MTAIRTDIRESPQANSDPCGINDTLRAPISLDGTPEIDRLYVVPAGRGRAVRLAKGRTIEIVNTHGTQVCDFWAFNAANLAEFLSWEHARAFIEKCSPEPGDVLVSNRRRAMLTFTADTSPGVHDTLIAPCDIFRYIDLGVETYHDSCADNLRLAMMAIGLVVPEVPGSFNIWMNIPVDPRGRIGWKPTVSKPGDSVRMRAEMDCIAVMSACPQDLIPINSLAPKDLHFRVLAAG
jgi:hypothetical protein